MTAASIAVPKRAANTADYIAPGCVPPPTEKVALKAGENRSALAYKTTCAIKKVRLAFQACFRLRERGVLPCSDSFEAVLALSNFRFISPT